MGRQLVSEYARVVADLLAAQARVEQLEAALRDAVQEMVTLHARDIDHVRLDIIEKCSAVLAGEGTPK